MGEPVSLYITRPSLYSPVSAASQRIVALDKFRMILLELHARHRQSPCVLAALHSPPWVRMPPSQDPLAKRSGSEQICSLR
jgi:hypothetical protein